MSYLDFHDLRSQVYSAFCAWREAGLFVGNQSAGVGIYTERANHLAWLLGRDKRFFDDMTEAEVAVCKALLGPHGYSYYRMLLAQRGG